MTAFANGAGSARAGASAPPRWGVDTDHNVRQFAVGEQRMPAELIHALAWLKWAAARANLELLRLDRETAQAIVEAAERVAAGEHDGEFPLSVWQSGTGAESHLNLSEVIAGLASAPARQPSSPGRRVDVHADVNLSQAASDVFAAAMQIAVALQVKARLLPALSGLRATLAVRGAAAGPGRGPWHDAVTQLARCETALRHALLAVHALALGDLAGGAGGGEFGAVVTAGLAARLQLPLVVAELPWPALAAADAVLALHGGLRRLAITLARIGQHLRRSPGTTAAVARARVEALAMVCAQVLGHDAALAFAASQAPADAGPLQPLLLLNTLDSVRLLADAMRSVSQVPAADTAVIAAPDGAVATPARPWPPVPLPATARVAIVGAPRPAGKAPAAPAWPATRQPGNADVD